MKLYRIAQELPAEMTSDEMLDFIVDNSLSNWQGEIDFSEAKHISNSSQKWILTELSLDVFPDWLADPDYTSTDLPPIVLDTGNGTYEVLDGKHRIGAANARGESSIKVYLGKFDI